MNRRFLYAVIGTIVMLAAGFIYSWSILSSPIANDFPQWTSAQLSLTFTLCMSFFCLGGIAAGILSKYVSPRCNLWIAAVFFLAGFFLTAQAKNLDVLYIGYGILCGTGSGFAYNTVMNIVPRWFPDRQGLISGVLLMGFGASSMIIGSVFTALTPTTFGGWRTSLMVMGLLMSTSLLVGSFFLKLPDGTVAPAAQAAKNCGDELELSPLQIIRRSGFWCFFLWAVLINAVGLVMIAQARGVALEAVPTLTPERLSFAVGLISVCNGFGRVLIGALFDKIGRKFTMVVVSLSMLAGTVLLAFSVSTHSLGLLLVGFPLVGLGYGGGPTVSAAVIKRFYGQKNYALNLPVINLNVMIASFASTVGGVLYDVSGTFTSVFVFLFICLAVSFGAMLSSRKA